MNKGYIRIHLLFLLCISCIINLAAAGAIKRKYPISARYDYEFCPALYLCPIPTAEESASNPNAEVEHWECIGRRLFAQPRTWRAPFEAHLVHDCTGVGFGNMLAGVNTAASLALTQGRRLVVTHPAYMRMFDRPFLDSKPASGYPSYPPGFDYSKYGMGAGTFERFANDLRWQPGNRTHPPIHYAHQSLGSGMCGNDGNMIRTGGCASTLLERFHSCADRLHLHDFAQSIPVYHSLFARPSQRLSDLIRRVRSRLGLPQNIAAEPHPGAWGLRVPGYYIMAVHFRRIPLGFEPLAPMLNNDDHIKWKLDMLKDFWPAVRRSAEKAKKVAQCRNQTLLIYFATDDVANLRPRALKEFSDIGRVVFGPRDNEVGHMIPQWSDAVVRGEQSVLVDTYSTERREVKPIPGEKVAQIGKTPEEVQKHADWSVAEWWIFAQSHWLVGGSGSNFAISSIGVGLGPRGAMERFEFINNGGSAMTIKRPHFRMDKRYCTITEAADSKFARKCPNNMAD